MSTFLVFLGIAVMIVALVLIPLGVPGLWVMLFVVAMGALAGEIGVAVLLVLFGVGVAAEMAEYFILKRVSARYGASGAAFWGAMAGGVAGMIVGLPVPVIGSLLAGLIGTFLGAAGVALVETRRLREMGRVGWGAVVGRALAAVAKTAAGVAILAVGGGALLF